MSYQIIGTCSVCGGPVGVPLAWWGIYPPEPECLHCHATVAKPYGPVIDMEPVKKRYKYNISGFDINNLWENLKPPTAEQIKKWRKGDERSY